MDSSIDDEVKAEERNNDRRKAWIMNTGSEFGVPLKKLYRRSKIEYRKKMEAEYVRTGILEQMNERHLVDVFYGLFHKPGLNADVYTIYRKYLEAIAFAFYVELEKIGSQNKYKGTLLDILARNHSERSVEYGLISNDKITRSKRK